MKNDRISARVSFTANQIYSDIAEYQAALARIPRDSNDPDDLLALRIFTDLLRDRRDTLAHLGGT